MNGYLHKLLSVANSNYIWIPNGCSLAFAQVHNFLLYVNPKLVRIVFHIRCVDFGCTPLAWARPLSLDIRRDRILELPYDGSNPLRAGGSPLLKKRTLFEG